MEFNGRVVIVQKHVPRYRVAFYEQVRDRLAGEGIELRLIYGQAVGEDALKGDAGTVDWGKFVRTRVLRLGRKEVCYQPVLRLTAKVDLVIVEQASRLLVNYLLLARQAMGGPKVAMWGHGENLQADGSALSKIAEKVKHVYTRLPYWFFAYTAGSAARVARLGVPSHKITVVQNSVDVGELSRYRRELSTHSLSQVHEELGTDPKTQCIYVGALYAEKRLDFLLAAGQAIAARLPTFSLLVIGAGPDREMIEFAAARFPWLHYVGPKFGREMASLVCSSRLMLLPGLVGLAVLDSFALGVPVFTMADSRHSPEFEYMISGDNGVVVEGSADTYADAVADALLDQDCIGRMKEACLRSAERFSLEEMSCRFASGVRAALE